MKELWESGELRVIVQKRRNNSTYSTLTIDPSEVHVMFI